MRKAFMGLVENKDCGRGNLKKSCPRFLEIEFFFWRGDDVVFNKTMVGLDFLLRFLSRKNEGFCFFDQKKVFVSFD
jgi:hypothetical protein